MPKSLDLIEASPEEVAHQLQTMEARGVWRNAPHDDAAVPIDSHTYRDVTAQVSRGVVNVFTQTTVIGGIYSDPLGVFPFKVGIPIPHRGSVLGSGFLIGNGYVVTSRRVVAAAQSIEVQIPNMAGGLPAQVLGAVPSTEVALLKIEPRETVAASLALGASAKVAAGEPVVAIGNPFGTGPTVRPGVVSFRVSRLPQTEESNEHGVEFFQTTAPIQPGESGGPLVDIHGAVIGMNVFPDTEGSPSKSAVHDAGYAVPIDAVKASVAQILSRPSVPVPNLPLP